MGATSKIPSAQEAYRQEQERSDDGAGIMSSVGKDWEMAADRLLLYLRLLNIPVLSRLELVFRALEATSRDTGFNDHHHLVAQSMRNLRRLLAEKNLLTQGGFPEVGSECQSLPCIGFLHGKFLEPGGIRRRQANDDLQSPPLVIAPPLNRAPMTSDDIDRTPWSSFFRKRLKRSRKDRG